MANGLFASLQAVAMKGWEFAGKWTDRQAELSQQYGGIYRLGKDGLALTDGSIHCQGDCRSLATEMGLTMGEQGDPKAHWWVRGRG